MREAHPAMATEWDWQHYRRQQEEFVSNHSGTTPREVLVAILPNICSIFLTLTIVSLLRQQTHSNIQLTLEFVLIIIPCIICCTVLSQHVVYICGLMLTLALINTVIILKRKNHSQNLSLCSNKIPFITNFRALTNIMTAICILAVDFPIFPRKFAKTEIFGYSLMDTGVGLFVVANALVSTEARNVNINEKSDFFNTFLKNVKGILPLFILGICRALAVEYLTYQRHISEYGLHWNFFITLAFVKFFTGLIPKTFGVRYSFLSGIWLLGMHEYALNTRGLKEWVLGETPRNDFISANREGLISLPGYVGLYLVSISIGRFIHSSYHRIITNSCSTKWKLCITIFGCNIDLIGILPMVLCMKLSLITVYACVVTLISDSYLGVSRRLVNLGYCAWIITLSTAVLTFLLLIDIMMDILNNAISVKVSTPKNINNKGKAKDQKEDVIICTKSLEIFEAVNYNGLCFFLLANFLTGAVNMTIKTLYVSEQYAIQILITYMAINIFTVVFLYRQNIQLKT